MREWDPIGVSGIREARDEYDSYIGMIADQLRSGSTADVAAKLGYIRSEWMGTPTDPTADVRIAELLRSWYEQEMDRWTASKGVR